MSQPRPLLSYLLGYRDDEVKKLPSCVIDTLAKWPVMMCMGGTTLQLEILTVGQGRPAQTGIDAWKKYEASPDKWKVSVPKSELLTYPTARQDPPENQLNLSDSLEKIYSNALYNELRVAPEESCFISAYSPFECSESLYVPFPSCDFKLLSFFELTRLRKTRYQVSMEYFNFPWATWIPREVGNLVAAQRTTGMECEATT